MATSRTAIVALALMFAGCGYPPLSHEIVPTNIHIGGSGRGWVGVSTESITHDQPVGDPTWMCLESCTLDIPYNENYFFVRAGTTQHSSLNCGAEDAARECTFIPGHDVFVTFDKDVDEVATLVPDEKVSALAFTNDGDLVMALPSSLRRVGLDGTQRWSVPRAAATLLASSTLDLIIVGPDVTAYHGDGTLAWTTTLNAVAVNILPDGSPVIVTAGEGRVVALSAVDGTVRWQSSGVGATTLAVDNAGIVAAAAGTTILRFDANGGALPSWQAPDVVSDLLFDPTNQLGATHVWPGGAGTYPEYELDYYQFDGNGDAHNVFTRATNPFHGFVATSNRLFHWGLRTFSAPFSLPLPPRLDMVALDLSGVVTWDLTKGYTYGYKDVYSADVIVPSCGVCDRNGRCAVAGTFDAPPDTGLANWIGVYTIR